MNLSPSFYFLLSIVISISPLYILYHNFSTPSSPQTETTSIEPDPLGPFVVANPVLASMEANVSFALDLNQNVQQPTTLNDDDTEEKPAPVLYLHDIKMLPTTSSLNSSNGSQNITFELDKDELQSLYQYTCMTRTNEGSPHNLKKWQIRLHSCITGSLVPNQFQKKLAGYLNWLRIIKTRIINMGLTLSRRTMHSLGCVAEDVILQNVPGDFVETGVWRGGLSILLRGVLVGLSRSGVVEPQVCDRVLWLCDSFRGLPPPDARYPADTGVDWSTVRGCMVDVNTVRKHFMDFRWFYSAQKVKFIVGLFNETLRTKVETKSISLLRLDGDLFQSTWDSLTALYPRVSLGGWVVVDDYYWNPPRYPCKKAVDLYRSLFTIKEEMVSCCRDENECNCIMWKKLKHTPCVDNSHVDDAMTKGGGYVL